ncbi:MAG: PAS domain S-box protein, partial [Proteobacteria bacterium]|nr:PAS domain S-box protein [Pseudomonadota bacterium]
MGLQGVLIDITERKAAEQALRESEEFLKKAQEIAHVGSWKWNLSSDSFEASEEMKLIYGLDSTDRFDSAWSIMEEVIHPEDKEHVFELSKRAAEGSAELINFRIVRPDGEIRWIEAPSAEVSHRANDGSPLILVGIVQDITERKQTEEALRESEEKYRTIVENVGTPILYYTLDGHLMLINREGAKVFGGIPEDFVGKSVYEITPSMGDVHMERLREILISGKGKEYEDMMELPSGNLWFRSNVQPVRDSNGEVFAFQIIATNITEHKVAQDLILHRNRELTALNVIAQTISESHDLYEIMNNAMNKTLEILSINIGAVYLMDKDTGNLSLKIHRGVTEEDAATVSTIKVGEGLLGTAVLSGEPSFIESFDDSPELIDNGAGQIVFGQKLNSAMFVPLVA